MNLRRRLHELVERKQGLVVPGAYDCVSARLVERAGFQAVYMTGYGTSASRLGPPDLGFAGLAEMADHARNMASAVSIPLIADADTGYGNALNVRRTVRMYETAGVAALHPQGGGGGPPGRRRHPLGGGADVGAADRDGGEDLRHAAPLQLRPRRPLSSAPLQASSRARVRHHPPPRGHALRGGQGDPGLPGGGERAGRRPGLHRPLHPLRGVQRTDRRDRADGHGGRLQVTRPPRILIVDDERMIVDYLEEYLQRLGYETATAANGRGALGGI